MNSELEHRQMVQDLMSALIDVLADHPGELQHDEVLCRASSWLKSRQELDAPPRQGIRSLSTGADQAIVSRSAK
jgi:hypothetical protein